MDELTCAEWRKQADGEISQWKGCKSPAVDFHKCPYREEIWNDETECRCCDDCKRGCLYET